MGCGVLEEPSALRNGVRHGCLQGCAWLVCPPSAGTTLRSNPGVAQALAEAVLELPSAILLEIHRGDEPPLEESDLMWGHKEKSLRTCA